MTEPKWTSAPWRFERMESAIEYAQLTGKDLADHDGYFRTNGGDWIVSAIDPDEEVGGPICEVAFKGKAKRGEAYKAPDPEGMANAHLIAAAKDLYEALARIIEDWDGEPEDMVVARLALARARGEQ